MLNKKQLKDTPEETLWDLYKVQKYLLARDEITNRYIAYAKQIAYNFYVGALHSIEYDDICSYAYLGLLDAIEKFQPNLNLKFKTYAHRRISGAIIDEARKQSIMTRGTRSKIKLFEAYVQSCPETYEKTVDELTLAKEFGISLYEYQQYKNKHVTSLDELIQTNDNSYLNTSHNHLYQNTTEDLSCMSTDAHYSAADPACIILADDLNSKLHKSISRLSKRNQEVIKDIFYTDTPLKLIAKKHKLTNCGIFQIKKKSLSIIKSESAQYHLQDYLTGCI